MKAEYKAGEISHTVDQEGGHNTAQECPTSGNAEGDLCRPLAMKICKGCRLEKPFEEYYFNKTKKRYFSECKVCNVARSSRWNKNNSDKYKANCEKHRQENRDLYKRYKKEEYSRNIEKYKNDGKVYRNSEHGKKVRLHLSRIREIAKSQWWIKNLTKEQKQSLKEFYRQCPKGYHVDHIIPLKGKNVCGLHVPWNLQYLTAQENIKKGNKF